MNAAADRARLPAEVLATAGTAYSAATEAIPARSASRLVQRSSGGAMLATDPHLPRVGGRAVAHGVDRPQLVGVAAARQLVLERPRALLNLPARARDVLALGEACVHGRALGDRQANARATGGSGDREVADRRRRAVRRPAARRRYRRRRR